MNWLSPLAYALALGGALMGKTAWRMSLGSWAFLSLMQIGRNQSLSLFTPLLSFLTLPVLGIVGFPSLWISVFLNSPSEHLRFLQITSRLINSAVLSILEVLGHLPAIWFLDRSSFCFGVLAASVFTVVFVLTPQPRHTKFRRSAGVFLLAILLARGGGFVPRNRGTRFSGTRSHPA